jgi:large subunit ribosomal protein L14
MIQTQTLLKVIDNSGARTAKCIKVLGGSRRRTANVGDIIVVAIQQVRSRSKYKLKVKKGEVFRAVVVQTKFKIKRMDGNKTKFDTNSVILLNKQQNPIATRILNPVAQELRIKALMKVAMLSPGLL